MNHHACIIGQKKLRCGSLNLLGKRNLIPISILFTHFPKFSFRLMLLEENQISFDSDDGFVKDHSRQIAEMIGLGSDAEFWQAGVSIGPMIYRFIFISLW